MGERSDPHLPVVFVERFRDLFLETERLVRLLPLPLSPILDPQVVGRPRRYALTFSLCRALAPRLPRDHLAFAGGSSVSNHLCDVREETMLGS